MGSEQLQNFYEKIFSLGGNVIRIPVHPEYYVKDEYYMWRYLDSIVEWAGKNGFYVIIDWHCIGNPITGSGENVSAIQNDIIGKSKEFWKLTAAHYKDVPNVIYEIYNEPTNINGTEWGKVANDLVDVVRQPILVTEWGYSDDDVNLSQSYLYGSEKSYGRPLTEFMNENGIGWVGAWYDDKWELVMFSDESGSLTKWGKFIVDLLAESNK